VAEDLEIARKDSSRRDFIKKSVAAGAIIWSAPVVTSLPGGRAWAAYRFCSCTSNAYGLRVIIPTIGLDQIYGVDGCLADTGVLGVPNTVTVQATVVCGSDTSGQDVNCIANADIATLDIIVGAVTALTPNGTVRVRASVLHADASSVCGTCASPVGHSSAASASLAGTLVGGTIGINVGTSCNLDVAHLGIVKVNEQTCDANSRLGVNALHVRFPATGTPLVEVIAAHADAGSVRSDGSTCACTTC